MRDLHMDPLVLDQYIKHYTRNKNAIVPITHPEIIFHGNVFYFHPAGEESSWGISVIVKAILTNPGHTGIWLAIEPNKNKLSIPGGHIAEPDMAVDGYVGKIMDRALAREFYEELGGTIYNDGMHNYHYMEALEYVTFILRMHEFNSTIYDRAVYVDYPSVYNTCIFYKLIEVDEPNIATVSLNTYIHHDKFLWYSREDHWINHQTKLNRRNLFPYHFKDDIRLTEDGVQLLDKIFYNEELFGKPYV